MKFVEFGFKSVCVCGFFFFTNPPFVSVPLKFPDIVKFAEDMANARKIVVVAALDGTFQRTGFGDILALVPLAESVEKLTAVCMSCFRDAAFTKRLGRETEVSDWGIWKLP